MAIHEDTHPHADAELIAAVGEALDIKRRDSTLTDDDLERLSSLDDRIRETKALTESGRIAKCQWAQTEVSDLLDGGCAVDLVQSILSDIVGDQGVLEKDGNLIGRRPIAPRPRISNLDDLRREALNLHSQAKYARRTMRALLDYMSNQDDEILRALARHGEIEVLSALDMAHAAGEYLRQYADMLDEPGAVAA